MEILGLALSWIELTFIIVFFVLMVIGASIDRDGASSPKWYILGIGFIAIGWYYWGDITMSSVVQVLQTWQFWKPIVVYLGIGIVYSILEFVLEIRRSARTLSKSWEGHKNEKITFDILDENGEQVLVDDDTDSLSGKRSTRIKARRRSTLGAEYLRLKNGEILPAHELNEVFKETRQFVEFNGTKSGIIGLRLGEDKLTVEPAVNSSRLADHVGAWTFLWPAYMFSLILGDLMAEVFKALASMMAKISARFVRMSFSDVFKA